MFKTAGCYSSFRPRDRKFAPYSMFWALRAINSAALYSTRPHQMLVVPHRAV